MTLSDTAVRKEEVALHHGMRNNDMGYCCVTKFGYEVCLLGMVMPAGL
jgi:hypothetical protein